MTRQVSVKNTPDVVPTVIVFEKGKVSKRLDGEPGAGLKEKQLKELISTP